LAASNTQIMLKNILVSGFIFLIFNFLPHYSFAQKAGDKIPGELIVQLKDLSDIQLLEKEYASFGLVLHEILSARMHIVLFHYEPSKVQSDFLLKGIKKSKSVIQAQENHQIELRESTENQPDDLYFGLQWNMNNIGADGGLAGADIDALRAWDITTGGLTAFGDTIVVAVVDGGSSLGHLDLNLFKNRNEIQGNGIDDDENGYIDDYNGWNAYNNSGQIPEHAHGTHVSGIVGARGNNTMGVTGVNWNVKILPIAGSSTQESTVIKAYSYVYEMRSLYNETHGEKGAFIVTTNSSFGVNNGQPDDYPIWGAMYDSLGTLGILNAAATANANVNVDVAGDIPTAFESPWLITVTNTTNQDIKFSSAGYGVLSIDLGAPGTQIYSTKLNNTYAYSTGTSMASPHIAGATALLFAAADSSFMEEYQAHPEAKILEIKQFLLQGTDPLEDLQGKTVSGGRLNLYNSLILMQNPVYLSLDKENIHLFLPQNSVGTDEFTVKNNGSDTVNLRLTLPNQANWILLSGDTFSLAPSDSVVVSTMISATMDPGSYQTEIQIYNNETYFKSVHVKVIVYNPEIQPATDHLSLILPVDTVSDSLIHIFNPMPVGAFIELSSLNGSSWLTFEPDTITIGANESIDLQLHINTNGLLKGNYTETVNINAGIAGLYPINIGLQVYDPSAVSENPSRSNTITVSPNPFISKVVFEFSTQNNSAAELVIVNSKGQQVYTKNLSSIAESFEWNGKSNSGKVCSSGVYQYTITQNGKIMASGSLIKR
jgi:hypothetical protein